MNKKFLSLTLSAFLAVGMLSGCGETVVTPINKSDVSESTDTDDDDNLIASNDLTSGAVNILTNINKKYASAPSNETSTFNNIIYDVPSDYTFSFDCNEKNMQSCYFDAFGVYTTPNFENSASYVRNCANVSLENGKIIIEPGVVDVFHDIEDDTITNDTNTYGAWKTESNGTWGSLNKLYLVQKYDLETGLKLEKPIITPFTVAHDIPSTTLKQKIDANNNYYLEWMDVEGASSYLVYKIENDAYKLVYKTKDTSATSDAFQAQLHSDYWSDIVNKELEENGYDTTVSKKLNMNSELHSGKDIGFAVVAVKNGETSGISNIVDTKEVADRLPYSLKENTMEITINNVMDMPTTVQMETVNGKTIDMVINYHGSSLKHEDETSTTLYLYPSVLNTDLSPFLITIHGMTFDDFMKDSTKLGERQDKLVNNISVPTTEPEINVTNVPDKEEEKKNSEIIEKENNISNNKTTSNESPSNENLEDDKKDTDKKDTEENSGSVGQSAEESTPTKEVEEENKPSSEPSNEPSSEPSTDSSSESPVTEKENDVKPSEEVATEDKTGEEPKEEVASNEPSSDNTTSQEPSSSPVSDNEMFAATAEAVSHNLSLLEEKSGVKIDDIIYANSPMEEWIADCFIARSQYIPLPASIFPEANDMDTTVKKIGSMYRQNPTSGVLAELSYSYEYETYIITYSDETNDRLNKTVEELKKAKEVSQNVTGNLSSDYDKVIALNDYFCQNASYDTSSMSTDVDMLSLDQSFIDAHTPYGILCKNYGVCESYSESFVLTGRLSGLDVLAETGTIFGGPHEWNKVKIDGSWCILDITNNDSDIVRNGLCNVSDAEASSALTPDGSCYIFDASANTDSFEYYRNNDAFASTITELEDKLTSQLDNNSTASVRYKAQVSQDELNQIAVDLYMKGYNISDGYSTFNVVVIKTE